ncbi:hypothetical protein [Streptomyces sp. NBC_01304]|uniref:hypothetical protein n=1 Tax=Streptomyces sp. NBC_01304 TaxID=2903818 RepID=UPI002E1168DA|nr:hypothetical protein OG430_47825 [Streptomyces sp. NBC_01304]
MILIPRFPTVRADLDLPGVGQLAMRVTRLDHGHVRYTVRGPHLRGTFVVIPEALADGTLLPSTVRVQFGDHGEPIDGDGSFYSYPRPDEPVVFNVRIHGWAKRINPDEPPAGWFLDRYATCLRDNGVQRELSTGVRRRTESVLRALVRHWAVRPDRTELITAAARREGDYLAKHEAGKAEVLEAEIRELAAQRQLARTRLNQVLGVIRRRALTVRPADPLGVKVPIVTGKGESLGAVTVREVAVNDQVAGTVVYEVTGHRLNGRFTVGREHFRPLPVPVGLRVTFGHVQSANDHFTHEREHAPWVNGVCINSFWDLDVAEGITPTTPEDLPARASTGVRAGMRPAWPTRQRTSAVLRVLALRYLARGDVEALQLAAAKAQAPYQRGMYRRELRELRARQRHLESLAAGHRCREQAYRALLV